MHETQATFKAIADPTRRAIIAMLAEGEMSVGDVASRFEMTRPAVAKHLGVLKTGGLTSVRAEGRERFHKLEPQALEPIRDWIEHYSRFWDEKLGNLKTAIEESED